MSSKTKGILFIAAGVIFLVIIVYFIFFYSAPIEPQPQPVSTTTAVLPEQKQDTAPKAAKTVNVKPLNKLEVSKEELKRLSASFAERYGSYSNQSNYQNMIDLKIFMTERFQKATDESIANMIAKKIDKSIYYGITTKAISQNIDEFDDENGNAKITVTTQRREAIASMGNAGGFPQSITIIYKKDGKIWKVDDAVWQAKGK